ncbi:glycosyltransferase auxiliary protein/glycosyltransferase auxiliary protein/mycaminosyltransferase auxiliary protein tylMIII [Streptomyces sp. Ag109_G2-6]|uniref:hypothetical protein n=1 Tax=Streptomyces TaxID=1883 RepID=UPI0009A50E38|nr:MULTISPECIES: hypothetical protein [Streptomyces]RPF25405.1 glycosyltransferase auxiliary protein/glycosyltransferase auxiliary protein/mycaminosyltransferase auxiliary protein tylMIII [Streptomyces sp. Ag109_G2-6]
MSSELLAGDPGREADRRARRNQLTRAAKWFAALEADPYARVLRTGTGTPDAAEEAVRALGPLHRSALPDTWVTAERAVAEEVVGHPAFDAPAPAPAPGVSGGAPPPFRSAVLTLDRASAAPLAALTAFGGPLLWADDADRLEKRTATWARRLLAALGDRFDLAEHYARRLTGPVLAEQLGLPEAAHERFCRLLPDCRHALDGLLCPQSHAAARAGEAAETALAGLLAEALYRPTADALRASQIMALGVAEPTAVLVSNAVRLLLAEPGGWRRLAEDPGRAGEAVARTLRTAPPVRLESRAVRCAVTLAGTALPVGARVTLLVAAVNRDPLAAPDAPPFGLCTDLHFGLSAHLVGPIARAALRTLAETLPDLRADGDPVTRLRSPVLRAPASQPVAAGPVA